MASLPNNVMLEVMANLNLLNIFITVAEYKNLTKAAEALYISQPAISSSIKKLEEEGFLNIDYPITPVDADILIIDEMSMVDMFLMNHILKAIYLGTKLVLVGDINQLPSVGPRNSSSGCQPLYGNYNGQYPLW